MFLNTWDQRAAQAATIAQSIGDQFKDAEKKISELVKLVVNASHLRVIVGYEKKNEELELQKPALAGKERNFSTPTSTTIGDLFELSIRFLSKPWKLWQTDRFDLQRLLLYLTFSKHLRYSLESGFKTPKPRCFSKC